MRKIAFVFFVLPFWGLHSFSQNQQLDSLKTLIKKETNTTEMVNLLNAISYEFSENNIDSSVFYANEALQLATKQNYQPGIALSHNYLARAFVEKNDFKTGISHYLSSIDILSETKDSALILDCYRGLSYVYSFSSNQITSLNYNLKALEIAIPLKDTNSLSILYNNMAVTYLKIGDYKSSKFYFNKTIELDLVLNVPYNTAISYSNLGVLYLRSHELEEATKSYQKVLHLLPLVNLVYVKPYLFISLVKYYTEIKNYQAALSYADSALWLCNEYHYDHIKARLFRRLGELYLSQNKFQESIQYLDQCLQVSAEIGMAEALPDVYNLKAQAYSNLSLFEKAYHAQEMSQMMRDSLKSSETAIILGEYEEEQRTKNELMRQQLQHELKYQKQENTRIKMMLKFRYALIVIILLALALVIGFYLFFSLRNKNKLLQKQHLLINEQKEQLEKHNQLLIKSEENLQELNATKDKFFSIIAHDLKSPFSAIIGFSDELYESYEDYADQERKQMIRQIKNSSHNTFDLLENLLTWSQSQSGFIRLEFSALNIKNLTEKSISAYLPAAKRKNLEVKFKIDKEITAWGDEETLKVLISNLFNNAIKFSRNNTEIILSAQRHKNYLEFCVQDFGIGMSRTILKDLFKIETNVQRSGTSNEKGTGLGLILCQEFIHKNNGKIWVESEEGKGSKFCFTLPLTKDAQA